MPVLMTTVLFLPGLGKIVHEMKLEMLKGFFNLEIGVLFCALDIFRCLIQLVASFICFRKLC